MLFSSVPVERGQPRRIKFNENNINNDITWQCQNETQFQCEKGSNVLVCIGKSNF